MSAVKAAVLAGWQQPLEIREHPDVREVAPGEALVRVEMAGIVDPFGFIDLCEQARRQPGSALEGVAREIQRAEWQLLFDHCARPKK